MNEALFFIHLLLVLALLFASLRFGEAGLIAYICLQSIFANLFVVKQVDLFGLEVTCTDAYAVGALLGLNVLQEYFGARASVKAVYVSLLSSLAFVIMAHLHISYAPSLGDTTHASYSQIFSSTARIVFASLAVFFFVQQLDVRLFGWMQRRWRSSSFPLRVLISLLILQSVDTILFSFAGLYGIVSSVFDVMLMSLPIKWIAILCSTPFVSLCQRWVKKREIA